ncbi:amidoligase family protein [Clostridium cellulovorans]|uniref:Virulence-related protein n=1 Tax=Clostridium cellulovorans (strain ATCC 35296 / DSM 3052 / OCM 3 / 743B) TaxID=573061 RepID=D9SSL6_CLOC7|nr:amidoligase family protein [Clostridium cellulovorans]ADL50613.1 hypothetical protein Clocel_0843 [Clostridium cellulovorans 743B]
MKENQYKLILKVKGLERKATSKVIGDFFGVEPRYLGAPSFNFEIQTQKGETFIVDRNGAIITPTYEIEETSEVIELYSKIAEAGAESIEIEIKLSMNGHRGISLKNLINIISSKQSLIKKALGIERNIVEQDFIEGINNVRLIEIEDFKRSALEIGVDKCEGISFDFEEEAIGFKFFKEKAEPQDLFAYLQLTQALNDNAKTLRHSSPKTTETNNEKYTFRTWLLRLGFIGNRYKESRSQLLRHLSGNSAFRSPTNA